jgi:acyl-coenzyme A thioesterase PaaI-like protein
MTETAANTEARKPDAAWELADHRELADLVEATRRLMSAVALSDVPPDDLRHAAQQLERIAGELAVAARKRCVRLPLPSGSFRGRVPSSGDPVLGIFNPIAVPLIVTIDEDGSAKGTLTPGAMFEGPIGSVHGGYSAMLMDAIMGTLVRALGTSAMTGTLTVRYLAPTPLDRPLDVSARVLSWERRKTTVEGWISVDGTPTVQGTGIFVSPSAAIR